MKRKTIRLAPTEWHLDVFVGKFDRKVLSSIYHLDDDELNDKENRVGLVTTVYLESKKENRLLLWLRKRKDTIVVHEVIHVLWYLQMVCNTEMNFASQEWQAQMAEDIFRQVMNKDGYDKIK